MNMVQIGWLAGLIEGEGCIVATQSVRSGKWKSRTLRLSIEMTDLDVLKKVKELLPTSRLSERKVKLQNPAHKTRYILHLTGTPMASILMTIYPLMGERRKQKIEQALELFKQMRRYDGHKKCQPAAGALQ